MKITPLAMKHDKKSFSEMTKSVAVSHTWTDTPATSADFNRQ